MNKTVINVPAGIRYISEWSEFYRDFPRFPHIMDKQIPGCGFTEWCLTNPDDIILCSPRNMLILNKWEQHPDDVFRVYNSKFNIDPNVDKELNDDRKSSSTEVSEFIEKLKEITKEEISSFNAELRRDLSVYIQSKREKGKPLKILVTYDSFRILKGVLQDYFKIFDGFQIIIDEFQSIFTDSRFKSSTELEFVNDLQGIQRLCYVSATPMMGQYTEMIPEFSGLPYYELDWSALDPGRVVKPNLEVRIINSIYTPIKKIIEKYLKGQYEKRTVKRNDGTLMSVESKEAVIYVNSVNNIISIIKKNGLSPDQVNVLCSNTPENQSRLEKKLGKEWVIGKVPLPGETRKMFTMCTRTVYLGADFYSDNARTFILSDANIECLAVDISLDLPQIMGRQRLISNPWKNSATFFYKPLKRDDGKIATSEDLNAKIKEKLEKTESLIRSWSKANMGVDKHNLAEVFQREAKNENYKNNYVAVNIHAGSDLKPVINHLVMVAEQRAFDIQQTDYADRFTVFSTISDTFGIKSSIVDEVKTFLNGYSKIDGVREKLIYINEYDMSDEARRIAFNQLEENIKEYLLLGHDRLIGLSYNLSRLKADLGIKSSFNEEDLKTRIYSEFKESDKITKADLKEKLKRIYSNANYNKNATASDIEDWFEIKRVRINKKEGFELIKKKL